MPIVSSWVCDQYDTFKRGSSTWGLMPCDIWGLTLPWIFKTILSLNLSSITKIWYKNGTGPEVWSLAHTFIHTCYTCHIYPGWSQRYSWPWPMITMWPSVTLVATHWYWQTRWYSLSYWWSYWELCLLLYPLFYSSYGDHFIGTKLSLRLILSDRHQWPGLCQHQDQHHLWLMY